MGALNYPTNLSNATGVLPSSNGGTGISNNDASKITIVGNFALAFTLGNATNVTLPTNGTLATLTGVETFANKRITQRIFSEAFNATPALDLDAGTITFYKNNVSQGVAFSGISGTILAAASVQNTSSAKADFGASTFVYSPPIGFNAGWYN